MPLSSRQASRLLSLLIVCAALAACSGNPPRPGTSSATVANPQRSSRGNPPFYEVFGERYYVLDSSDGYRERGVASWYGSDFHGRPTSSGEVYDMRQMTAAHKTLPLPSWVEVTNLTNGRQVIVKVNDRGPFIDNRVIDLSQRAAEELDMIRDGTARVQVRALGAPVALPSAPVFVAAPPAPAREQALPLPLPLPLPQAQAQAQARAPARSGGFSVISEAAADMPGPGDRAFRPLYVQVGAFGDRNNAMQLVERLKRGGFQNSFVLTSGEGRDRLHRVRIGPLADSGQFDRIQADLRAAGVNDSRLVQDN